VQLTNLPSDAPKMPKWIFLLGDAILLLVAWFIHDGADHPYAGVALISTVGCVVVAVFIGVIPFVTDYARRQDEVLDNRHRSLQALAVTVAAASEQISIAATGLNGISEAAQDNYSKTERLSKEISDKVAALEAQLAKAKKDDGASMAKLDACVEKFGKLAAELDASVARAAKAPEARQAAKAVASPEPAPVIASAIAEVRPAVMATARPIQVPAPATRPEPKPEPVAVAPVEAVISAPEPTPAPSEETPAPAAAAESLEAAPATASVPRRRSPRKPPAVVADAPALAAEPVAPAVETAARELVLESPPVEEAPAAMSQEISEPAVSADGATRLIVTAYIGIGNRLFIRGDGPGLSWDKGVPLTFVSIGKWRWETNDATSALRFRLFKNDTVECTALGEATVQPGAQQEINASF
jgi:uncharacterized protein YoxC